MPIPVKDQFTEIQKQQAQQMFYAGKTRAEIGQVLGKPPRTIGKLLSALGLKRDRAEAASLKIKSSLDSPEIIATIETLRKDHNLAQIAEKLGSSASAVHRVCKKHNIALPGDYKRQQSDRIKKAWSPEKKRETAMRARERCTPEVIGKIRESSRKAWKNAHYRKVQAEKRALQQFQTSAIQKHLYSILDDLKVSYFREYDDKPNDPETIIGPYNFDCVVPRPGRPALLIECNGDYWHSSEKVIRKDNQKQSYIRNNYADSYECKVIWEHEFKCKDKVSDLLKYWLGIDSPDVEDFSFSDIDINQVDVRTANSLLDKYHYLSGCGRGGIIYGASYKGQLVAVCAFSSLVRQNLPYDQASSRELSRFCIHPRFRKKNFGSWFISRAIKLLPPNIKLIVSYCDTTFNHDGALYKSCNFTKDGVVRPDYWYVHESKWVMHKKTLYDHAKKMSMSEAKFADMHGYKRVYGAEKIRFLFNR